MEYKVKVLVTEHPGAEGVEDNEGKSDCVSRPVA